MIDRLRLVPFALCAALLLGACGGGGDDGGGGDAGGVPASGTDAGEGGSDVGAGADGDATGGDDGDTAEPGGEPEDNGAVALDAPRRWTLGPASFEANGDAATAQRSENGIVAVVVGTSGFDRSNGPYSGSAVSLTLTDAGDGLYTVSDVETVVRAAAAGTPAATLNVVAGTLQVDPLASTRWAATASTGQLSVRVDDEGRYHVSTVGPLTLSRELDLGSGIPNSPDTIDFAATNLHGRVIEISAP